MAINPYCTSFKTTRRNYLYHFQVFFPSFLQSDIYFKYLNELLNSVSDTPHSDEISVASESTKIQSTDENTLLVDAFGSELDLAENPDAIWHRPNAG